MSTEGIQVEQGLICPPRILLKIKSSPFLMWTASMEKLSAFQQTTWLSKECQPSFVTCHGFLLTSHPITPASKDTAVSFNVLTLFLLEGGANHFVPETLSSSPQAEAQLPSQQPGSPEQINLWS